MSHHFDDRGRQFDSIGSLNDWWTPADAAAYKANADRVVRAIKARLKERFAIEHATVEIECEGCADAPEATMHPRRRVANG